MTLVQIEDLGRSKCCVGARVGVVCQCNVNVSMGLLSEELNRESGLKSEFRKTTLTSQFLTT